MKEKRDKDTEIKSLNIRLNSLRAEKTRNEETLTTHKELKEFLDKLAPKVFIINWIIKRNEMKLDKC